MTASLHGMHSGHLGIFGSKCQDNPNWFDREVPERVRLRAVIVASIHTDER